MALRVIVEADGGSRGNPGPAGYGALVRDAETGELLAEAAASIGVASNNVAEYRGLIAGLTAALELGATDVEIRMDSKLVVEQMSSNWAIKHPDMRRLATEAATLLRRFDSASFTHIRRELNKHADRLANEAMDAAAAGRQWSASDSAGAVETKHPGPTKSEANRLVGWAAPAGPATTALLVRHGETPLSIDRKFNGVNDSVLTDRGSRQAKAVAERLAESPVAAVACSPLKRTRQTAEAIASALDLDVVDDDGLMETNFGAWDGLTFAEVRKRWPDLLEQWLADPSIEPPDGESFDAVAARVASARDRLCSEWPERAIAVVSHVTPIKILVRDALEAPTKAIYRIHIDPASVSRIDWHVDHHAVVQLLNDTSHLGQHATGHTV